MSGHAGFDLEAWPTQIVIYRNCFKIGTRHVTRILEGF